MAKREDYQTGKRIRDNTQHADTVRKYWLDKGYLVNVRVCVLTGEIISDLFNGMPKNVDPEDVRAAPSVPRDEVERIEAEFLEIYQVKMDQVRARGGRKLTPDAVSARNSIWHALNSELGMTHNAIAQRYNRSRNTVTWGIRKAEGE